MKSYLGNSQSPLSLLTQLSTLSTLSAISAISALTPTTAFSNTELVHRIEDLRSLVLNFCERYLYNLHDAEEACQDTLFKAYRGYTNFKGKSSFRTWVMSIASNVCASFYRSNSKYRNAVSDDGFQHPEEGGETSEITLEFNSLIASLNHQEKNILSLHFVKDMQFTEIAKCLAMNKSTVKMCYYRALDKFESNLLAAA
jgi:RNA polymerase sigma-70 factor (ECF subfamily)